MRETVSKIFERFKSKESALSKIHKGKGMIEVLVVESQDGSALQNNNYDI